MTMRKESIKEWEAATARALNEELGAPRSGSMTEREQKKLRKAFKAHTDDVKAFIVLLEDAVRRLSGVELGRRIADLTNKLEMRNDLARRFALELDFNGRPLKQGRAFGEEARQEKP